MTPKPIVTRQKGAADSNPSALKRWLVSRYVSHITSEKVIQSKRLKVEKLRIKHKQPYVIDYFHAVDDPYSHLAVQLIKPLLSAYGHNSQVQVKCHLVTSLDAVNMPEPELFYSLALRDARTIAPYFKLNFPNATTIPNDKHLSVANAILTMALDESECPLTFAETAEKVGLALWNNSSFDKNYPLANNQATQQCMQRGNKLRQQLQHYASGMFHYAGEWYWGVDRFYHLDTRLSQLLNKPPVAIKAPNIPLVVHEHQKELTLEFYPSLRSPYTSIIYDKTLELVKTSRVNLVLKPVMPMVMRGVPVSRTKGFYIFTDCAREARAKGLDWGHFYDPIGTPVLNCFALYAWAKQYNKAGELMGAFLQAAFFQGINTNKLSGLKQVVLNAGLNWNEAQNVLAKINLEDCTFLEKNRADMYRCGIWGVPCFRLIDTNGKEIISAWGQDRLWLIADYINHYR